MEKLILVGGGRREQYQLEMNRSLCSTKKEGVTIDRNSNLRNK